MANTYVSWKTLYLATKLIPWWTMIVTADPWITIGRLYLVNGIITEWIEFTSVSGSGSMWTLWGLTRDIDPGNWTKTSMSTGKTWLATQHCIIVAMHDQLVDKTTDWIQGDNKAIIFGSNQVAYIKTTDNWVNLYFKDSSNLVTSLSMLTSGAGTDHKVLATNADTTAWFLFTKINTAGNGIRLVVSNAWANETGAIYIDFATQAEAQAGTNTTNLTSPARVKDYVDTRVATTGDFSTGTSTTLLPTVAQIYSLNSIIYLDQTHIRNDLGTAIINWIRLASGSTTGVLFSFRIGWDYTSISSIIVHTKADATNNWDIVLTTGTYRNRPWDWEASDEDIARVYWYNWVKDACMAVTLNGAWRDGIWAIAKWDYISIWLYRIGGSGSDTYTWTIVILWVTITLA